MSTPVTENGWRQTTLSDVLPLKYGKARSTQFGYERENTATFGSNGAFGTFTRALTEKPAIIVGRKGAAGAVHYSSEPCWPIDTAFYTEGTDETYLPFFSYLLENLRLGQMDRSTAIPSLSRDDYNAQVISYPQSLDEQRRIVAEIEKQFTRLDAGVSALQRVRSKLKQYRAAVLKAACEGRLVPTEADLARQNVEAASRRLNTQQPSGKMPHPPSGYERAEVLLERVLQDRRAQWNGRGKYSEPAPPSTPDLPELPEGWVWTRLEQLGFTFGGLTKNPKRGKLPNQLPYLRVANVYANELRLKEIECIGVDDSEFEKLLLQKDDLLIVEGNGSKDQIGRLAIWDGSIEPCVHQNHLIKVRPVETKLSRWILYWLMSRGGRHFVELVASSTSGLYTLSVNKVGNLPIVLPPLPEQERIVAEVERRLSVVDELDATVTANLQRAARLRQAILQKAFSGQM